MIVDFIKEHLHASSPLTMVFALSVGVCFLFLRPSSRWPRRYLLGVLVGFWFLSTYAGASLLVAGLGRGFGRLHTREEARGSDAVVVLGGGAATFSVDAQVAGVLTSPSMLRALEGARVAKLIGARLVVASGGTPRPDLQLRPESEMLAAVLVGAGVPADRVIEESASRTTSDQARLVPAILRAHGIDRFVIVTSPVHMRRSLALFRAYGLAPVASVAPMRSEHLPRPSFVIPNQSSLIISDEALYDYAAWMYYWWNGLLKPHS